MTRYAMAIDAERCIGCQACMVACKTENELPPGYFRLRMRAVVVGTFPNLRGEFRMEQCFHCEQSPCVSVCPTGATYKTANGLVKIDPEKCTGCKACVTACPYEMRYIHPDGYADKCTFCEHRLAEGRVPACVETCPTGARVFGDLDDNASTLSKALRAAGKVDVLKPEANTKPKLYYLNAQFVNADLAEAVTSVTSKMAGGH